MTLKSSSPLSTIHHNSSQTDIPLSKKNEKKTFHTLPQHVAIIMDGNGRWAKQKKLKREKGHENGVNPVKASILECIQLGIPYLSVYVFSTENWKRPRHEVSFIMQMLSKRLRNNYDFYRQNNIRIVHSGNREALNKSTLKEIDKVVNETKHNTAVTLNMACNYGGKDEIIRGIKNFFSQGNTLSQLNEHEFTKYLDTPELPDIDLLIRTGGHARLSNFFLWKVAYAELYFTNVLWPDWSKENFLDAIQFYQSVKRKFGALKENF